MRIIGFVVKQQIVVLTLGLAACSPSSDQNVASNQAAVPANDAAPIDPYAQAGNVDLPDDRTPLEEPNGPIDAKSPEAAGQVVQRFGALIEQGYWAEAEALWGDAAAARRFTADLKRNRETHLEVGRPGRPEGAAGSIYVTVPITIYGKSNAGGEFRRAADAVLRRVNDVPGSTEAQRRWHFERIGLKGA